MLQKSKNTFKICQKLLKDLFFGFLKNFGNFKKWPNISLYF